MAMKDDFLAKVEEQLESLEKRLEAYADKRTPEQSGEIASVEQKRATLHDKLEQLRSDTGDRFDVLRMGVESAWSELKAAFDTATGPITHEGEPPKQEGEPLKKTG